MNRELAQTYLSRAIDGELPAARQAELDAWLAANPAERELAADWNRIGALARAADASAAVPDVELAWQDIRRAIRTAAPDSDRARILPWRWLLTGGIVGALSLAAFVAFRAAMPEVVAGTATAQVDWVDSAVPGASPMVMQDQESGLAVVWLLPASSDDHT